MSDALGKIAIIGMSARLPGAPNLQTFWQNLKDGRESITFFSTEELRAAGVDPALLADPHYVKAGGALKDIDLFDAAFFGFTPREATILDPQQRLFMECAWEALEQANCVPEKVAGQIGVYAGAGLSGYLLANLIPGADPTDQGAHLNYLLANDKDYLATHLSYKLNLKGPSITVQTACSTSLVAVVLACQSLLSYQCDVALAGGANIKVPHKVGHLYEAGSAYSADGHCRAFDARGQGPAFGSGVGVVVLKRLEDALADGDPIQAVILGSTINNDGNLKVGYTAPSVDGQAEVIALAQAMAGVPAESITYIEAHGTGTPFGDPIEVAALSRVFRTSTARKGFCALGSVKTNFGHLEAAAGIAGLMKTVLALQHNLLPPSLHFSTPNPEIDFANSPFYVNTQLVPWTTEGAPRRAGVSAFGVGGTNAHLVLEEAPPTSVSAATNAKPAQAWRLLTLSAKSNAALLELAHRYVAFLGEQPRPTDNLADLCYTAHTARSHFAHRLALTAASSDQLQEQLANFRVPSGRSQANTGVSQGYVGQQQRPKIAFLFTGQGSQYINMGRELYATQPRFRATLQRCDKILHAYLGESLLNVLYPGEEGRGRQGDKVTGRQGDRETGTESQSKIQSLSLPVQAWKDPKSKIDEVIFAQPATFALAYALADLWKAWGIEPDIVLGHSLGEYVAACVAGVFSLEDALKLVCARGRLIQSLPPEGETVAVLMSESAMAELLKQHPDVSFAAINSPEGVVISGRRQAVHPIVAQLQAQNKKVKVLNTTVAAHSPLMEPILDSFEQVVRTLKLAPPRSPIVSCMTGDLVQARLTDPSYWREHLRQPVRFAAGVQTLFQQGCTIFIEIGPKPTLLSMTEQCLDQENSHHAVMLPSLRQGKSDWQQLVESVGALYTQGIEVDWQSFDEAENRQKVTLPTYPFQRQRYWVDAPKRQRHDAGLRPLLDKLTRLPLHQELLFETEFSVAALPFLADHRVFGAVISPGGCQLAMILGGSEVAWGKQACTLTDVLFPEPFVVPEHGARTAQLIFSTFATNGTIKEYPAQSACQLISLSPVHETAAANEEPAIHATGKVMLKDWQTPAPVSIETLQTRCQTAIDLAILYQGIAQQQVELGPHFRWLTAVWHDQGEALGQVRLPDVVASMAGYVVHPGLLDACFQLAGIASSIAEGVALRLPFALEALHVHQSPTGETWWCHVQQVAAAAGGEHKWNIQLLDNTGQVLIEMLGFTLRAARPDLIHGKEPWREWLYQVEWQPQALVQPTMPATHQGGRPWLLLMDNTGVGTALASALQAKGENPILVFAGDSFSQIDATTFAIHPDTSADYQQLCTILNAVTPAVQGVIHLWSLNTSSTSRPADLEQTLRLGCGSALHLVQALLKTAAKPPALWLVTRDAQAVLATDTVTGVIQAPVWGLGKVIALEHPELRCTRIDLAGIDQSQTATVAEQTAAAAHQICAELLAAPVAQVREDQIAWRQAERYVARLVRCMLPDTPSLTCHGDATYLITGGLGGLGLLVARWLVEQGAKHLLLLGRSQPKPSAQHQLDALAQLGATVMVAQADVSDLNQVATALAAIDPAYPLRGIIHAAGVVDDGILLQQSWPRFMKVLASKVWGAWHLHQLTQAAPTFGRPPSGALDFFVCFSSTASLLGSVGQANYAAANAFLDAFAAYRQAQKRPALTINWSAWSEVGGAADLVEQTRPQRAGQMEPFIAPAQGLQILASLLAQTLPQVGVVPMNWAAHNGTAALAQPFLADIAARLSSTSASDAAAHNGAVNILQQLQAAPPPLRKDHLRRYLQNEVARLLGLNHLPEINQTFVELGMDSLMALALKKSLEKALETSLPSTLAFEYPAVESLTLYLAQQVLGLDELSPESTDEADEVIVRQAIEELSADGLMALISEEYQAYQGESV